jgi:hypothetical protein
MADTYKMKLVWSGAELDRGRLVQVSLDGDGIPWEGPGGIAPNWYLQIVHQEAQRAGVVRGGTTLDAPNSLTANENQCVMLPAGRFLYMDVGRWLHGHHDFGLVAGNNAYLCRFAPGSKTSGSSPNESDKAENAVLTIPGVSVEKHLKILGPFPKNYSHLYLILPDMHVPEAMLPDDPDLSDLQQAHPENWKVQQKRDCIFNSRESIPAMTEFLSKIRAVARDQGVSITLVQLGDMYELWAGRDCQFRDVSDDDYLSLLANNKPAVQLLRSPAEEGMPSVEEVGMWIAGTHNLHRSLFAQFEACKNELPDCRFLHGNHDSYLSLSEVVDSANQTMQDLYARKANPWAGTLSQYTQPKPIYDPPPKVFYRERNLFFEGIFIEHGQRFDWANRDGKQYGWEKTNDALNSPGQIEKLFDSTRRGTFVAGATAWWTLCRNNKSKNFGLYVQGHTHTPELKYVEVAHVREDDVWVPRGDREVLRRKFTPIPGGAQ